MFLPFKLVGLIVGGVIAIAACIMFYQAADIRMNYTLVEARITSVETDCFIKENYKNKLVDEATQKLAYMDCSKAPAAAAKHKFEKRDIRKRAQIAYRYTSPVDANKYTGHFERNDDVEDLVVGKTVFVHAHNGEPDNSRTTKSNFFIADSGV